MLLGFLTEEKKFDGGATERETKGLCGTASMTPSSTTQNVDNFFLLHHPVGLAHLSW